MVCLFDPLSTYPVVCLSIRLSVYIPCGLSLSVPRSTYPVVCLRPSLCLPTLWSVSLSVPLSTYPVVCLCPSLDLPILWSVSLSVPLSTYPARRAEGSDPRTARLSSVRFSALPWSVLPVPPSGLATSWLLCRSPAGVAVADLRRRYVSACPTEAGLHVAACVPWRACRLSLHTLHQKQAF